MIKLITWAVLGFALYKGVQLWESYDSHPAVNSVRGIECIFSTEGFILNEEGKVRCE